MKRLDRLIEELDKRESCCFAGVTNQDICKYVKEVVRVISVMELAHGTREKIQEQDNADLEKTRRGLVGVDPATYYKGDPGHLGLS